MSPGDNSSLLSSSKCGTTRGSLVTDTAFGSCPSATVDSRGRLILPKQLARDYGIKPGSELPLRAKADGLLIRPPVSQLRKVYVEPTNRCNLACRTCMRNVWDEPMGDMSAATFGRILSGLGALQPRPSLFFGGFGEPLLHSGIGEMVREAGQVTRGVELITNGLLLDRALSHQLIKSGLNTLWVSVDGASPESYADVRMSDSLNGVLQNIATYHELYRELHGGEADIGVVFVAMKRNIDDFPTLIRQTSRLGISRYMLTNVLPYTTEMCAEVLYRHSADRLNGNPSPWNPSIQLPEIDINPVTREALFRIWTAHPGGLKERVDRCPFIEQCSTSVGWDGGVSPCLALLHSNQSYLFDFKRSVHNYRLGNVNDRPLMEIWLSGEYTEFRNKVEQFDFAPCTICASCEMAEANREDCFGNNFPTCGGCLWAKGVIQCP